MKLVEITPGLWVNPEQVGAVLDASDGLDARILIGGYQMNLPWSVSVDHVRAKLVNAGRELAVAAEPVAESEAIRELCEAIRLSVEYVGLDRLQPHEGWSWYDALVKYAPETAAQLRAMVPIRDARPHSRACGPLEHPHGPRCHSNCPTCGGKPASPMSVTR